MTSARTLPKVAILDDYQGIALTAADWSPIQDLVTIDVYSETLLDQDALVARLEPYAIICAMRERTKFPASLLDRLSNLKLIATTGMWNAGIDVQYANKKGIVVSGTGGAGNSTLEHIWALILGTARYVALEDAGGRRFGLVGVGRLGTQTAKIAKAFNMEVIGWSPNLTPERAARAGVTFIATKAELLRQSDIVSIHMVLSERTRHLITAQDLVLLKPTAIFINTSRGPLVDEEALVSVLRERRITGAGLDVFDVEPLPLDHPLRDLDNVTLSPHLGYVSDDNYGVFFKHTVENIASFLEGKPSRVMS